MDNSSKPNAANGHKRSGNFTIMTKPQGIFISRPERFLYYIDEDGMTFIKHATNRFDEWEVGSIPDGAKLC